MNLLRRLLGIVLTIGLIAGLLLAWTNQQDIYDWWRLRNYEPSAEIVQLAQSTTMTKEGQQIFYVAQPLLVDELEFNNACKPESTIVLGCYISGRGIYLYNIEDERLAGVKEVTAAHEMLHAAYERLSSKERSRVDGLTQQAFRSLGNERILNNVEEYRKRDPAIVPNELHSILATEVQTLPAELEEYYSRYFSNRSVLVGFSERYEAEFQRRRDRVVALESEMEQLKLVIEGGKQELDLQYEVLIREKNQLDSLRAAGQTTEYNQRVPTFNQHVDSYNARVLEVQKQIDRHNELVRQHNTLVVEVRDLVDSIDSRPQSFR